MNFKILRKAIQILSNHSSKRLRPAPRTLHPTECKEATTSRPDLEKVTHTGQVFAKDDYRNVRFTNAKRYANEQFALNITHMNPPQETTKRVVHCNGGGPLGHPIFYINLDKPGIHYCYYCGNSYVKK